MSCYIIRSPLLIRLQLHRLVVHMNSLSIFLLGNSISIVGPSMFNNHPLYSIIFLLFNLAVATSLQKEPPVPCKNFIHSHERCVKLCVLLMQDSIQLGTPSLYLYCNSYISWPNFEHQLSVRRLKSFA